MLESTEIASGEESYKSVSSVRSHHNSQVIASWRDPDGQIADCEERLCMIQTIIGHSLYMNGEWKDHYMAFVKRYSTQIDSDYSQPLTVWKVRQYVAPGPASFILVQRLSRRFASALSTDQRAIVVIPLMSKLVLQ